MLVAGLFATVVLLSTFLADAASAVAPVPSQVRVGAAPRHPARSRVVGLLASTTRIPLTVTLTPRDPTLLASYASAVSTPGSSAYRHYLTVAEFRRRFGPSAAQIDAVDASLVAQGLRPGAVSANGLSIPVSATAGAIGRAFSVSFQRLALADGRTVFTNVQAPQFTSSVAKLVQGVIGLDDLVLARPLGLAEAPAAGRSAATVTGSPQPCSTAGTDARGDDVYTAGQFASAYEFSSLYGAGDLGSGQTVALYELEPNKTSDISAYQSCYGTDASVSDVTVDGGAGNAESGYGSGEAALDIEGVIGLAPQASVLVYQGPNNGGTGPYDTYSAIVSQDRASVGLDLLGAVRVRARFRSGKRGEHAVPGGCDPGAVDLRGRRRRRFRGLRQRCACGRRSREPAVRDRCRRHDAVGARAAAHADGVERPVLERALRRRRGDLDHLDDAVVSVGCALVAERDQRRLIGQPVRRGVGQPLP